MFGTKQFPSSPSLMTKKMILCAIDFSDPSLPALNWAFDFAKCCQGHVTILFCYRLIPAEDHEKGSNIKRIFESEAQKKINELEGRVLNDSPVSHQFITEVGFLPSRIAEFVRMTPVNLLVMSSTFSDNFVDHPDQSFQHFINSCKIPVVIVPDETKEV